MGANDSIRQSLHVSAETIGGLADQTGRIATVGAELVAALKAGHKILTAGNGGSAAEALHMAEELTGRFKGNRISLPAVALVADATALTCIGNDYGFDFVFSRQVEGLGKPGDILVLFSTSGSAENLRLALEEAHRKNMKTVCLLGRDGGKLASRATHEIIVKSEETARIQEAHQVLLHLFLETIEQAFAV